MMSGKMKKSLLLCILIGLSACGSNPASYLEPQAEPIVNISSALAETVAIDAKADLLRLRNLSDQTQRLRYTLIWYDALGVTQSVARTLDFRDDNMLEAQWQTLNLFGRSEQNIKLQKPTAESVNYRIYLSEN